MVPKLKILFLKGSIKGQKYLLELSVLDNEGKSKFLIGDGTDDECDIFVNEGKENKVMISFREDCGWILTLSIDSKSCSNPYVIW